MAYGQRYCPRMQDKQPPNSSDPTSPKRSAGGVFIAFGIIAGAIIGGVLGQPSIGLIAGLALGCAIALLIWLKER